MLNELYQGLVKQFLCLLKGVIIVVDHEGRNDFVLGDVKEEGELVRLSEKLYGDDKHVEVLQIFEDGLEYLGDSLDFGELVVYVLDGEHLDELT